MYKFTFTLTLFLASSVAFAQDAVDTFTIENSIQIDADIDTVFEFAANPQNDTMWRSEVNVMDADGPWEVGTTYYEDSHLGLNPHYMTPTKLIVLEIPSRMVVQTPQDNLFLRATRTFEANENGKTLMTYKLEVDKRMPADASRLYLPQFIVKIYYNHVMQNYLRKLRSLLER